MERNRALNMLRVVSGVALLAVLGVQAVSEAAEEPRPEAVIEMVALRYYPPRLEIATGTVVVFYNREPFDYPLIGGGHELLSEYYGAFESPNIAPGAQWRHRFEQPGTYRYRCKRHLGSTGEIVVVGEPVIDTEEP
jgi:plastocyanin